jgi:hypothetical protein
MRRLTVARMAALGGAMVLAGLLAGTAGAQTDQPSGQNHPDQVLQRKLDLLDHGQDTPDAPPPPVNADKGTFPGSVRIPGTNTSVRIYGQGTETLEYSR